MTPCCRVDYLCVTKGPEPNSVLIAILNQVSIPQRVSGMAL